VPNRPTAVRFVLPLTLALVVANLVPSVVAALEPSPLASELDARIDEGKGRLIEWRRHLHEHPELSNREVESPVTASRR